MQMENINRQKYQSFAGRLRERFSEVEDLLGRGFKQEYILELFKKEGFDISESAFRSTIHRIRKERAKSPPKPPQNRPQPLRQDVDITEPEKTHKKCDFAKQLNSFKLEDLIK